MTFNFDFTNGVRSQQYPRSLFVFSAYWGKGSRVLRFMQRTSGLDSSLDSSQVEVNCQPVNTWHALDSEWKKTESLWIRRHGTTRGEKDVYSDVLPLDVYEMMLEHMQEDSVNRILHADFLPLIDWDKYTKVSNGGAYFDAICVADVNATA